MVENLEEQEELNSYFQETVYGQVGGRFVPYMCRDKRTGLALQYSQWGGGQPNGKETENWSRPRVSASSSQRTSTLQQDAFPGRTR